MNYEETVKCTSKGMSGEELKRRQALPLGQKIALSINVMEEFYKMYEGKVYVSTGGVDSTIVMWLCSQSEILKDIDGVCVAALEPINNVKFNKLRGDTFVNPPKTKIEVIKDWGFPLVSKEVAMKISRYNNSKHDWAKDRRLNGYMGRNGKWLYDSRIPLKYQALIYAPFDFTEKCCDVTKKKPLKTYEKETGKYPITGEIAEESLNRKLNYLKNGCITTTTSKIKCTPLGFWTKADIFEVIEKYKIEYSDEYGDIVSDDNGGKKFLLEQRTGCDICGFGIMYDTNRFDRMKEKSPLLFHGMLSGGEWVRTDKYKWVKFRPTSIPIWSNLRWKPTNRYGYRVPLNYIFETQGVNKRFKYNKDNNEYDIVTRE